LVLDGVNNGIFRKCVASARIWKDDDEQKTVIMTMSNKIVRLHKHEEIAFGIGKNVNCTQHSWTFEEYKRAFIHADGRRTQLFNEKIEIFAKEWEIEEDDESVECINPHFRKRHWEGRRKLASVLEVICQKFVVCGGSARWMLQLTRSEIEAIISKYLSEALSISSLLSFDLGPTSPEAKTYMYYSVESLSSGTTSTTVYTIGSERATQLLMEKKGSAAVQMLYSQACLIKNPAFLGWVVEADFFFCCQHNNLSLLKRGENDFTKFECHN
jgi:hypothetical protein